FLEERRPARPVGEALQQHGPAFHGREQRPFDGLVEAHEVELGVAPLVEEDLLGVADHDLVTGRLDRRAVVGHGVDGTPGQSSRSGSGGGGTGSRRRASLLRTSLTRVPTRCTVSGTSGGGTSSERSSSTSASGSSQSSQRS